MCYETENFNLETDPKLACTCGHILCKQQRLEYTELLRLQLLRDACKRPLRVSSGGRCQYHRDERHREKKADHQRGIGVDIAASGGLHRGRVLSNALLLGYNTVGVYRWGLHLAHRPELPQGDILIWPGV